MFLESDEGGDMNAETQPTPSRGNIMTPTVSKRDLIDYARMMLGGTSEERIT